MPPVQVSTSIVFSFTPTQFVISTDSGASLTLKRCVSKTMFIFLTETKPLVVVLYSCISITPTSRHALNKHKKVSSHLFIIVIIFFQSLVERLNLNAQDITIQSVHPSIIGQDTWFQITYTSTGTTR